VRPSASRTTRRLSRSASIAARTSGTGTSGLVVGTSEAANSRAGALSGTSADTSPRSTSPAKAAPSSRTTFRRLGFSSFRRTSPTVASTGRLLGRRTMTSPIRLLAACSRVPVKFTQRPACISLAAVPTSPAMSPPRTRDRILRRPGTGRSGTAGLGGVPRAIGRWLVALVAVLRSPDDLQICILTDSWDRTPGRGRSGCPLLPGRRAELHGADRQRPGNVRCWSGLRRSGKAGAALAAPIAQLPASRPAYRPPPTAKRAPGIRDRFRQDY
jgi:hypothetical protein